MMGSLYGSSPGQNSVYELGITDFFNARHAVGDEPPHAHSWRVEAKFRRKRYLGEQSLMDLASTRQKLRGLFSRYEDRFLNEVPPFTFQQPTVENIVTYLFEQLQKEFRGTEIDFISMTIWDSPTSYVTLHVEQ